MTPLEPLYTLRVAAEMIPFPSINALQTFLYRHPQFVPRYRQWVGRRWVRLLTLSECAAIRRMVVKPERSGFTKNKHGKTVATSSMGPIVATDDRADRDGSVRRQSVARPRPR